MFDTQEMVEHLCERYDWQYANEYGEPGYSLRDGGCIILGDYWCRCGKVVEPDSFNDGATRPALHSVDSHYPAIFRRLEENGVELEWDDEWTVDWDNGGKAYRTSADSYSWQSSIRYTEHGDMLTPDDDLATWLDVGEFVNNPSNCLPSNVWTRSDLLAAGWAQWAPDDEQDYQSGWHPGQTDDPTAITATIHEAMAEDGETEADEDRVQIVFLLDEASQFYVGFSAWTRTVDTEEEE